MALELEKAIIPNGSPVSGRQPMKSVDLGISDEGEASFDGEARVNWTKITADSITLTEGGGVGGVADLQTKHDGDYYHIDETATTPGMDLIIDFESVQAFNWVQVIAYYNGSAPHAGITVQLYNWNTASWETFSFYMHHPTVGALADDLTDSSFFVPDDTNYIGTGGDDGNVRVRLCHCAGGNPPHDHDIDVVALYQ